MSFNRHRIAPPAQEEVEGEIYKATQHGEVTSVAVWVHEKPAKLSRELNPDYPQYEAKIYAAAHLLWGAGQVRLELAERWFAPLARVMDRLRAAEAEAAGAVVRLDAKARRSLWELIGAEIDRLPIRERLETVRCAMRELKNLEAGLMHQDLEDAPEIESTERIS